MQISFLKQYLKVFLYGILLAVLPVIALLFMFQPYFLRDSVKFHVAAPQYTEIYLQTQNSPNLDWPPIGEVAVYEGNNDLQQMSFMVQAHGKPGKIRFSFGYEPMEYKISAITFIRFGFLKYDLLAEDIQKVYSKTKNLADIVCGGKFLSFAAVGTKNILYSSNEGSLEFFQCHGWVCNRAAAAMFVLIVLLWSVIALCITLLLRSGKFSNHVPKYDVHEICEKQNKYCICVFVINEGEKLLNQLKEMSVICRNRVDIVVADGGSTDGSTDLDLQKSFGVNALLIKRDTGKLGSQMRMAFDWALKRGYAGVIVVDGNGKDGMDAIPRFADELDKGVDHVQGSRFIPGGYQKNTPLSRLLGLKLLHAPAMRIATGFPYTDTTNGFRAYSRKLLCSPELDIFRDCFSGYELHYYMAAEAPRTGFRCSEIPVSRVYPAQGKVPTKISGIRGNIDLLKKLFLACTGFYSGKFWLFLLMCLMAVGAAVLLCLPAVRSLQFNFMSPDSYATYSLAKHLFSDFMSSPLLRSPDLPVTGGEYSNSFPPGYPFAVAILLKCLPGTSIYSQVLLNFLWTILLFCIVYKTFRIFEPVPRAVFLTLSCSFVFLLNHNVFMTIASGWSMIQAYLLQMIIFYLILKRDELTWFRIFLISLCSGFCVLTRFDWLIAAVFTITAVPWALGRKRFLQMLFSWLVFAVSISPWIIYSLCRFHTLWATDNKDNAFSAFILRPSYYSKALEQNNSLLSMPDIWCEKILQPLSVFIGECGIFLVPALICMIVSFFMIWRGSHDAVLRSAEDKLFARKTILIVLIIGANLGAIMLSGYWDKRYFCGIILELSVLMLIWSMRFISHLQNSKRIISAYILLFGFTLLPAFCDYTAIKNASRNQTASSWMSWKYAILAEKRIQKKFEPYRKYIEARKPGARGIIVDDGKCGLFQFGAPAAFADLKIYCHFLMDDEKGIFVPSFYETMKPDYLLTDNPETAGKVGEYFDLEPVSELPCLFWINSFHKK